MPKKIKSNKVNAKASQNAGLSKGMFMTPNVKVFNKFDVTAEVEHPFGSFNNIYLPNVTGKFKGLQVAKKAERAKVINKLTVHFQMKSYLANDFFGSRPEQGEAARLAAGRPSFLVAALNPGQPGHALLTEIDAKKFPLDYARLSNGDIPTATAWRQWREARDAAGGKTPAAAGNNPVNARGAQVQANIAKFQSNIDDRAARDVDAVAARIDDYHRRPWPASAQHSDGYYPVETAQGPAAWKGSIDRETPKLDSLCRLFVAADALYQNGGTTRASAVFLGVQLRTVLQQRFLKYNRAGSPEFDSLLEALVPEAICRRQIVLSSHGLWLPSLGTVTVPRHVRLFFYTYHGTEVHDYWANRLDNLTPRTHDGKNLGYMPPVEVCGPGTVLPNYNWQSGSALDLKPPGKSNIQLRVSEGLHHGITLKELFDDWLPRNREVDLHWSACRESITTRTSGMADSTAKLNLTDDQLHAGLAMAATQLPRLSFGRDTLRTYRLGEVMTLYPFYVHVDADFDKVDEMQGWLDDTQNCGRGAWVAGPYGSGGHLMFYFREQGKAQAFANAFTDSLK